MRGLLFPPTSTFFALDRIPNLIYIYLFFSSSSPISSSIFQSRLLILAVTTCHPAGDLLAVIGRYTANLQPMPPALDPGGLGD